MNRLLHPLLDSEFSPSPSVSTGERIGSAIGSRYGLVGSLVGEVLGGYVEQKLRNR